MGAGLSLSPQQSLLTMEEIDSVEETQVKERKCILLRIRGGKQFVLQCDVSVPRNARWGWPPRLGPSHPLWGHQPPLPGASHLLLAGHLPWVPVAPAGH